MDKLEPGDYKITVKGIVQVTQIILHGEDVEGKEFEMVLDSNRRPIPVPYSEEP